MAMLVVVTYVMSACSDFGMSVNPPFSGLHFQGMARLLACTKSQVHAVPRTPRLIFLCTHRDHDLSYATGFLYKGC